MPIKMTIAMSLIGLAGVATAGVGVLLPHNERLASLLALVAGAGVGIVALAIGSQVVGETGSYETLFLVASILGFAATILALALLWWAIKRPTRDGPQRPVNVRDVISALLALIGPGRSRWRTDRAPVPSPNLSRRHAAGPKEIEFSTFWTTGQNAENLEALVRKVHPRGSRKRRHDGSMLSHRALRRPSLADHDPTLPELPRA